MGANTSLLSSDTSNMLDNTSNVNTNLGDMPESCVALILSYLEPVDICRLARINRAFRAASTADFIWASKLPSNYRNLAGSLLVNYTNSKKLGEKEIFARLSRGVSFDSGNKVRIYIIYMSTFSLFHSERLVIYISLVNLAKFH